jgi:hypothetical protein
MLNWALRHESMLLSLIKQHARKVLVHGETSMYAFWIPALNESK